MRAVMVARSAGCWGLKKMLEMQLTLQLKPSQRVAMAKALLPQARAEAKKRQRNGRRTCFFTGNATDMLAVPRETSASPLICFARRGIRSSKRSRL
jgi:hypothetical protein